MSQEQSLLDKIKDKLQNGAEELRERRENFSELAALRVRLNTHKKDTEALFTRYGRAVYENHPAEIQQIILQELRPITAEIARLEAELSSLTESHDEGDEQDAPKPNPVVSADRSTAGAIAVTSEVTVGRAPTAEAHKPFLGIGAAPTGTQTTAKPTTDDKFSTK